MKRLRALKQINVTTAILIMAVLAGAGIWIISRSLAAGPAASFEAESGTLAGGAAKAADAAASGAAAVAFRGVSTPAPSTTPTPGSGLSYAQVMAMVNAFKAANTGKDTDINRSPGADKPGAAALRGVCGAGWASIYPQLAWEYGGVDHPWINPSVSPLLICVHTPVAAPFIPDWKYAAAVDRVTATVFVKFPDKEPCGDLIQACVGDPTNFEILVDEASGGASDGSSAGLVLTNSKTELFLKRATGALELLYSNI